MAEDEKKRIESQKEELGESGLAEKAKQLEDANEFNNVRSLYFRELTKCQLAVTFMGVLSTRNTVNLNLNLKSCARAWK